MHEDDPFQADTHRSELMTIYESLSFADSSEQGVKSEITITLDHSGSSAEMDHLTSVLRAFLGLYHETLERIMQGYSAASIKTNSMPQPRPALLREFTYAGKGGTITISLSSNGKLNPPLEYRAL